MTVHIVENRKKYELYTLFMSLGFGPEWKENKPFKTWSSNEISKYNKIGTPELVEKPVLSGPLQDYLDKAKKSLIKNPHVTLLGDILMEGSAQELNGLKVLGTVLSQIPQTKPLGKTFKALGVFESFMKKSSTYSLLQGKSGKVYIYKPVRVFFSDGTTIPPTSPWVGKRNDGYKLY